MESLISDEYITEPLDFYVDDELGYFDDEDNENSGYYDDEDYYKEVVSQPYKKSIMDLQDLDIILLKQVDDYDFYNLCHSNRYFKQLCENDKQLLNRMINYKEKLKNIKKTIVNLPLQLQSLNCHRVDITESKYGRFFNITQDEYAEAKAREKALELRDSRRSQYEKNIEIENARQGAMNAYPVYKNQDLWAFEKEDYDLYIKEIKIKKAIENEIKRLKASIPYLH